MDEKFETYQIMKDNLCSVAYYFCRRFGMIHNPCENISFLVGFGVKSVGFGVKKGWVGCKQEIFTLMAQQNLCSLSNGIRLQQHRFELLYGRPLQQPILTLSCVLNCDLRLRSRIASTSASVIGSSPSEVKVKTL